MRARWLGPWLVVAIAAACSRRDVDKERPRALPPQEVADAKPPPAACEAGLCHGACLDFDRDPAHCGGCDHACDAGACVAGLCTRAVAWPDSALKLMTAPCNIGARIAVHCPATPTPTGPLWGSDLYTADSSVCMAARHAGFVNPAGGDAAIEIMPGAPSYAGTTRHGVTSSGWGAYGCSFRFVSTSGCEPPTTACAGHCANLANDHDDCGACGTKCGPEESCRKGACGPGIDANWGTTASDRTCAFTAVPIYTYFCPPGGSAGTVWGTGIYTHDSSICTAAVHAGKITLAAGGSVTIAMHAGLASYKGTTANGIKTNPYAYWHCAFEFR